MGKGFVGGVVGEVVGDRVVAEGGVIRQGSGSGNLPTWGFGGERGRRRRRRGRWGRQRVAEEETTEAEPPREGVGGGGDAEDGVGGVGGRAELGRHRAARGSVVRADGGVGGHFRLVWRGLGRKNLGWRSQEGGRELRRKVRHSSTGRCKVRRPVP